MNKELNDPSFSLCLFIEADNIKQRSLQKEHGNVQK